MTSILFPSPEELAADPALAQLAVDMRHIIAVANGNFTHATPEPRRHDPASVTAGVIRNHSLFWSKFLLPNTNLPPEDQTLLSQWVSHGVDWRTFAKNPTDAPSTIPIHRPNYNITGFAPSGEPLHDWVSGQIEAYVRNGVLIPHPSPTVTLPLTVEKSKPRLIWDGREANQLCSPPKFSYENLRTFRQEINQHDGLIVVDLVSGFSHVGIAPDSQHMFGCEWSDLSYVYTCLPFGWSPAPFVFQRLMVAVAAFLAKLDLPSLVYLDDLSARAYRATHLRSKELRGLDASFVLQEVFWLCGLRLHATKCQLVPSTSVRCLGFIIDSDAMTFRMLPERVTKLALLAANLRTSHSHVSRHDLQSFIGKAVSLLLAAPCIRAYLVPLWDTLSASKLSILPMTDTIRAALAEFSPENLRRWEALARWVPDTHAAVHINTLCVFSDAAGGESGIQTTNGWGGVLFPPGATVGTPARGHFIGPEADLPIHIKEALAAIRMLEMSGVHDTRAILYTDNSNVYSALRKSYSAAPVFRSTIRQCVEWQLTNNVVLTVHWLSSKRNAGADFESRSVGTDRTITHYRPIVPIAPLPSADEPLDLMLHPEICQRAQQWALLSCTIDICASHDNKQCTRFIGFDHSDDPNQVSVDCLSAHFSDEIVWANPPFAILPYVIKHLQAVGARGLLVFPGHHSAPWFRSLLRSTTRITKAASKGDKNIFWLSQGGQDKPRHSPKPCPFDVFIALFDFPLPSIC